MQCIGEFPLLAELLEEHGRDRLAVLGIAIDEDCGKPRAILEEQPVASWPQVCDGKGMAGEAARTFNVKGVPSYYVLDAEGRIVAKRLPAEELGETVSNVLNGGTAEETASR